ncbi:hypothetical protein SORBI_3002G052300 [Sorghum bicolor]|uniref:Uncharacterized protein n=1 Tax=Sorghum bicolor TaxID=4558 RepID=A0A1W0W2F2_SORBI|nr:hypothetical protein SORBI_3002G052300 [Sorghum bicolor]
MNENGGVVTCPRLPYALKGLSDGRFKDIDVVLVQAAKVAKCGFDFRSIIESDLRIPVVYYLAPDHKATGDEADQLLHTLQEATYIIKKPFDDGKELGSTLPMVIAWRKCVLESQAKRAVDDAVEAASALPGSSSTNNVDEKGENEEEGRVHFKVVKSTVRNRKRKSGSGCDPSASSSSLAATGGGGAGCYSISMQDMVAPPVGNHFTGLMTGGGDMTVGASSSIAADASLLQPSDRSSQQFDQDMIATMLAVYASPDYPPVEPQQHHVDEAGEATNEAAMALASLYMDNFISYDTVGSLIAPHDRQVLGMDSNVNELTMAGGGGAFDSNAASFMDLGVAAPPNDDKLLSPGAQDNDDDDDYIFRSLMGSQGPADMAVDGNAGLMAGMFPYDDQFEDDTPFPLEALLEETEADMGNNADQDDQLQGGASGAGAAAAADVAGTTSLVNGEGGGMMSVWDMGATATDGAKELQAAMYNNADQDDQLQGGATGGASAANAAGTTSLVSGEGGVMSDWDWDMGDFFMDSTGDFMFPHPHYMDSPK